jgi:glyoxylase-like metal-dependent hydrolase (beta-lactamase superfamily II)
MAAVNAPLAGVRRIEIGVPFLGSVNIWLLEGAPLTLVDTGPANPESLAALEEGLQAHGYDLADVELVLLTHHHLDHTGLTSAIVARSGARVAATAGTAAWGIGYHERAALEREFGRRLLAEHGAPDSVIDAAEPFWAHIVTNSADFATTDLLAHDGLVDAGGRRLRVVERPGHSVTDTLFVDVADGLAIVGDHLLPEITSGAEVVPTEPWGPVRRRALVEYLASLRQTMAMPLDVLLPGHGPMIPDHRTLVADRLEFHERRLERVTDALQDGAATAYEIAGRVWDEETAETQVVLAVWEIVGHLDVLADRGLVEEVVDPTGLHRFSFAATAASIPQST